MRRRDFIGGVLTAGTARILAGAGDPFHAAISKEAENPMELYPGAYQISSLFGERNLFQYLFVGDSVVLFDTGVAPTPGVAIFPYLEKLGIRPERITMAITSHADGDHQGGNHAIKQASPRTLLACGADDQEMIEDPQVLWDRRYNFLKADYGVGVDRDPSPDAGKPEKVDVGFAGGERIRIRKDWQLEVLHVPGHSHGHLALYDPQHQSAFIADAVHGRGCPKARGGMALPVTYYYVDVYLSTLGLLENLPINTLYTAHWPIMRNGEIGDFFAESRQTVRTFDQVILASLNRHPEGLAQTQLIDALGKAFSDWPQDTLIFAMFAIQGHMDRLEQEGKVRLVRDQRPFKWVLT
jgi:glyoxylase-like metal-dependent hydrolase (beta-lactamase superfamily II)